jgi:hypothetical protein
MVVISLSVSPGFANVTWRGSGGKLKVNGKGSGRFFEKKLRKKRL